MHKLDLSIVHWCTSILSGKLLRSCDIDMICATESQVAIADHGEVNREVLQCKCRKRAMEMPCIDPRKTFDVRSAQQV